MNAKPRILIVDDDSVSRRMMELLLVKEAYDISLANNGKEAMDAVGKFHPDVILVDINMPNMNGYELCKRLRATAKGRMIPLVLVSYMDENSAKKSAAVGANAFLPKPIRRDTLCEQVQVMWTLRQNYLLLATKINTLVRKISTGETWA